MAETTALVVPVLDERPTTDVVAALVRTCLAHGIVQRALVVDGGSGDGTPDALRSAGVAVLDARELAGPAEVRGKGDSVWRAARAIEADRFVLVDGDLRGVGPQEVLALGRALDAPGVELAKASFLRRQRDGDEERELQGRVTELLARPLLHRWAPDLDHVRVPLSGQQAVRRSTLLSMPLLSGYGLETALLLGVRARFGPDAVVDVPLPPISHDSKTDASLVPMAHQVLAATAWALGLDPGATPLDPHADPGAGLHVLPPAAPTAAGSQR